MPFTFSHPAIIIPFKWLPRRYVSMTGLVVGSIAPDFEKFIKMSGGNIYSHTFWGILWFNVPMGLALAFLFHLVVRNILIDHSPLFFRERLEHYKDFNWPKRFQKKPVVVIVCIMFAALLHILFDTVTHEGAPYIYLFPALLNEVAIGPLYFIGDLNVAWVIILNLSLSVLGLFFVIANFIKMPVKSVRKKKKLLLPFWMVVFVLTSIIIGLKLGIGGMVDHRHMVYVVMGSGFISILLSSAIWEKLITNQRNS
jgi:hypothetical protein